jgi:hypothetical protein
VLHTKGKTNYMGGRDVAKLMWRETETAKVIMTRTDLVTLTKPFPAPGLVQTTWSCVVARPGAVRRCFTHSDPQGVAETMKDGDSDGG